MPQLWEVVGGADAGGILAREGESLKSRQLPERLSTGAWISELELSASSGRLRFQRVAGDGPSTGWVSLKTGGKWLLERRDSSAAPRDTAAPLPPQAGWKEERDGTEGASRPAPVRDLSQLKSFMTASKIRNDALTHADLRRTDETWAPPEDSVSARLYSIVRSQPPFCEGMLCVDPKQESPRNFAQRFLAQGRAWAWTLDLSVARFRELAYEGFVPGSLELHVEGILVQTLLLWWGIARSVLDVSRMHISRRVIKLAGRFTMTVDQAYDEVLLGCARQHGEGWLFRGLRWLCRRLFAEGRSGSAPIATHSFELWDEDGTLVAGDLGYTVGSVYTSVTGFRRRGTSGAGEVQLVLTMALLHKMGYEWMDLGMPMEYKDSLGASNLSREAFLERFRACRDRRVRCGHCRVQGDELLAYAFEAARAPTHWRTLDVPPPDLQAALGPMRARLEEHVLACLHAYDTSQDLPRREDYSCSHRNGYETHLRCKALKELRTEISIQCRQRARAAASAAGGAPRVAVLALMAAHVRTEARAERLRHVLRSVERQELRGEDAELVVVVSWSAVGEGVAAEVRRALAGLEGLVTVQQRGRCSQFQHLAHALAAAEAELLRRPGGDGGDGRSVWVVFGDDDDLWHHRRVAEYVRAIRSHPALDGVGVFATLNRANCRDSKVTDADMPCNETQVNAFLGSGRGYRVEAEEPFSGWYKKLHAAGALASTLSVPDDIFLEYFDFCPRLRLVHEFFSLVEPRILEHRYCDLRFGHFLRTYPLRGSERGLELAFFKPECWMYFYACSYQDEQQWRESLEGTDRDALGNAGHMSSEMQVEPADAALAAKSIEEFQAHEDGLALPKLERYLAAFRGTMEVFLMPCYKSKIDQRIFDAFVALAASRSFGTFGEKSRGLPEPECNNVWQLMCRIGRGAAKDMAAAFDVSVLWHEPERFMGPESFGKGGCGEEKGQGEAQQQGISLAGGAKGGKDSWGAAVPQSHSKHGVSTFFWW